MAEEEKALSSVDKVLAPEKDMRSKDLYNSYLKQIQLGKPRQRTALSLKILTTNVTKNTVEYIMLTAS